MKIWSSLLFGLVVLLHFLEAYKILVYNVKFGTSHVNFMGKLADILVKAGHDVTVYAPTIDDSILTNGTKLAKVITRPRDFPMETFLSSEEIQDRYWSGDHLIDKLHEDFAKLCRKQFKDEPLIDRLKNEKFDIAIVEHFDYCSYGILRKIGFKNYITVSSSTVFNAIASDLGIPATPSFIPNLGLVDDAPPFSYTQRAKNVFISMVSYFYAHRFVGGEIIDFLRKELDPNFDISEEIGNSALYFANVDEHVDLPRPISHKIIYIGGIGQNQKQSTKKTLDKKFSEIMDKSKRGVVLMSFGTVALSHAMPEKLKQTILKAFSNFPDITFIWKYEKDEHKIAEGYKNVITDKWVPQNEILEHPKFLAFISHGGMNSVQEISAKGIPTIMIPIFADQPLNAKILESRGVAIALDRNTLTVEELTAAIKKVIEDPSYKKNAQRLASLVASKPMMAEERIVKYTEFAAKFGPDLNLDLYGRHLNVVEYYCLDIIVPGILLVCLVLYVVFRLLKKIVCKIFSLFVVSPKKKNE